jgi:hypothetical protein
MNNGPLSGSRVIDGRVAFMEPPPVDPTSCRSVAKLMAFKLASNRRRSF